MEIDTMSSLVWIAVGTLIAGFLFTIGLALYQYTYWRRRKLPSVDGLPIMGINANMYLQKVAFPEHARDLYSKCPDVTYYGSFDFQTPVVVVKDPELIREICVKSFDNFPDHRSFVSEEMDPVVGRNVFSLKGQRWKDVRSMLSPSFTANKMKIMFELVSECSKEFVQYFKDNPEMAKSFEAKDAFTRYTNDVIATAAFGVQVNSMRDRENEFYLHGKDATSFSSPLKILKFVLFRIFPKLVRMTGETFLSRATDRFFKRLVSSTVKTREEKGIVRPDMIQLLMQAKDKENGIEVTIDDIIGQAFIFFLAGFDTSSTAICFTAYELAVHQDIQDKLYKEIQEQLELENGEVTYESINKMKYLDMVISETLRLYPPASMTDRVCSKNFVLPSPGSGYPKFNVETNTNVIIPIMGFHRDAKYFPDPDKFDPERFNAENKDKINQYAYMPFGVGPRKCIGNRFALMEMKALLVHILKNFVIKLTNKSEYPIVFVKKITVAAENGFWIGFEDRKKTD